MANVITGNASNNTLSGTNTDDSITGLGGNDTLVGSRRNDTLDGGDGVDVANYTSLSQAIILGPQGTIDKGSLGSDRLIKIERIIAPIGKTNVVSLSSAGSGLSISANLATNSLNVSGVPGVGTIATAIENFVNVDGSVNNDSIVGSIANNSLTGAQGNDSIAAGDGNDSLNGGTGNDSLLGENGNDSFTASTGNDTLNGGNNNDIADYTSLSGPIVLKAQGAVSKGTLGNDLLVKVETILAPAGKFSTIDASAATTSANPINVNLATNSLSVSNVPTAGITANFKVVNFSDVIGSAGNDLLTGDTLDNALTGGSGNDTLDGGSADDTLTGNGGNDSLFGSTGNDSLNGVDGNDTIVDADGNDSLFGNAGNDSLHGGIGNDSLDGASAEDTLSGSDGNDFLSGSTGSDSLDGGVGNDFLQGGFGGLNEKDTLTGGAGNDSFILGNSSAIYYNGDFNNGFAVIQDLGTGDKIVLKKFASDYSLIKSLNLVGSAALDTVISTTSGDIIGVISDNTTLISDLNSTFLSYV